MRSLSSYSQLAGDLFETVQQSGTFSDSKTFVDAVPDRELAEIRERFEREHREPDFDIREFVSESFTLPEDPVTAADPSTISMEWYIDELWKHLIRDPSEEHEWSTQLSVPRRYVIAGGRFRESYYWDTYFAAIGLAVTGQIDLIADLAENFAALIDQYGCVPNGNRLYYVSRSHPPMFCHLLDILENESDGAVYLEYRTDGDESCLCMSGGEKHGPYKYRAYRDGNTVRREYLGKATDSDTS